MVVPSKYFAHTEGILLKRKSDSTHGFRFPSKNTFAAIFETLSKDQSFLQILEGWPFFFKNSGHKE